LIYTIGAKPFSRFFGTTRSYKGRWPQPLLPKRIWSKLFDDRGQNDYKTKRLVQGKAQAGKEREIT
jgi:hypothetical protein